MYAPETLVIDTWTSPVSISGTDLIKNLDEAVNSIVSTDINSIKNHVNRELAKISPYLSKEATKIYDETNLSAVSALDSKNSALASATTATDKATIATTKALEASTSASEALTSASNASTSETNADTSEANALIYKNSAEASATTATTQAGIATIKAGEASTSASNALESEVQAGVYAGMIAISVGTIENMTAISLPQEGQVVVVRDENRGGVFIYRPTGVSNGGTIFDSSSTGKWHRQYSGAVNVKWFGARSIDEVGFEIFDSSSAIISAITSGKSVIIEDNILVSSVSISYISNINILGKGKIKLTQDGSISFTNCNNINIKINEIAKPIISSNNIISFEYCNYVCIDGIRITQGNNTNSINMASIGNYHTSNVEIKNCYIEYSTLGFLTKFLDSTSIKILNNEFRWVSSTLTTYSEGIKLDAGQSVMVSGNKVIAGESTTNATSAITLESFSQSCIIQDNVLYGKENTSYLIRMSDADSFVLDVSYPKNHSIKNNIFYTYLNSKPAINITGSYIEFTNNIVHGTIICDYARTGEYSTIKNNVIKNDSTTLASISLIGCGSFYITDNIIFGGTYGIIKTGDSSLISSALYIENNKITGSIASAIYVIKLQVVKVRNNIIEVNASTNTIQVVSDGTHFISNNLFTGITTATIIYGRYSTEVICENNIFENNMPDSLKYAYANNITPTLMSYVATPTSGYWAKGTIVFNNNVVAGGFVGWVCTTSGTPGVWKTFGAITA